MVMEPRVLDTSQMLGHYLQGQQNQQQNALAKMHTDMQQKRMAQVDRQNAMQEQQYTQAQQEKLISELAYIDPQSPEAPQQYEYLRQIYVAKGEQFPEYAEALPIINMARQRETAKSSSLSEIYDENGKPQKAWVNPRTKTITPVGGAKKEKPKIEGGFVINENKAGGYSASPISGMPQRVDPEVMFEQRMAAQDKREAAREARDEKKRGLANRANEDKLRREFSGLPEVKEHAVIVSQMQRLDKAMAENAKGGSKVAVDQALITILNKMLDPSSVVRESEYARTPSDMAFISRMKGKLDKLNSGGAGLTDQERTAIANMARNFHDVSMSMYQAQADYYNGLATANEYNPENVVRPVGKSTATPQQLPSREEAPPGATGFDTSTGQWVY